MKKTIVSTNRLMILAVMMVMTISARSAMPLGSSKNAMSYNAAKNEALFLSDKGTTTGFTAHTMLTCTSPQYITMLLLCTILHLLRITQRLL